MKKVLTALICLVHLSAYSQTNGGVSVERDSRDNTVKSIEFPISSAPTFDNVDKVLENYLELSNQHSWKEKFTNDQDGDIVIRRYNQYYQEIPVEHGSMAVIAKEGVITFMNGSVYKPSTILSTKPVRTEKEAFEIAKNFIGADRYMWEEQPNAKMQEKLAATFNVPKGELVWVEDYSTGKELTKELHLAYRFDIFASEPLSRDLVYVDANTGNILLKDPKIKHIAATGTAVYSGNVSFETYLLSTGPNTYSLEDTSRDVYTYDLHNTTNFWGATDFTNNTTTWGKDYSIDAHWGTTMVFDYWKKEHNRISYDGFGGNLISYVNFSTNYNNAFWTGTYMVYGNGSGMFNNGIDPLTALDVCAHEVGHGVCEYTANLVYALESGAMNEGFSDIWGAVIENYAAPDKQMWTVGEEVLRGGALRSMSNPSLRNHPDTYNGSNWVNVIGCNPTSGNDNCGVHTNSGVLNYWFYLLTMGGSGKNDMGNDYVVNGLGVKTAAKIAYATEQMLSSNATYASCRSASISAAKSIYGNCSREAEAVTRAWYAVGVGSAFMPCSPQVGFAIKDTTVVKDIVTTICPAIKSIKIPLVITGGAPSGGNAQVTVAGAGSVVNGVDYTIPANTLTFNAGSTATQDIQVAIHDNGDTVKERVLKLYISITPNGSNLTKGYVYDTCYVRIINEKAFVDSNGNIARRVNTADIKSKSISPFFGRNSRARTQFIITADELTAAGVIPNTPITAIEFNVTEKNSTMPFTGFTLKISPTNFNDLSMGYANVSTQYYSGNYSTQQGWNRLAFSNNLVWNGIDNLAVETCFTNSTTNNENDYIEGHGAQAYVTAVAHADFGSGCSLAYNSGYKAISKPVVRFVQALGATEIETQVSSSREWPLKQSQEVYFSNSTNNKLIANMSDVNVDLGCVKSNVIQQGVGVTAMSTPYATVNKTVKEFSINVSQNDTIATYNLAVYFDASELSGVNLSNVRVVGTNMTVDSMMDSTNSIVVIPVKIQGETSVGYKASFTGGIYDRYFLVDNDIVLPSSEPESIVQMSKNTGNIFVENNPFYNQLRVRYNLQKSAEAEMFLVDITGRVVYKEAIKLVNSNGVITIDPPMIPAGTYVLQVMTENEVMNAKVIKQ